jgi:hypothetical protein
VTQGRGSHSRKRPERLTRVMDRDGWCCYWCGVALTLDKEQVVTSRVAGIKEKARPPGKARAEPVLATEDHVVPWAESHDHSLGNVVAACELCQLKRNAAHWRRSKKRPCGCGCEGVVRWLPPVSRGRGPLWRHTVIERREPTKARTAKKRRQNARRKARKRAHDAAYFQMRGCPVRVGERGRRATAGGVVVMGVRQARMRADLASPAHWRGWRGRWRCRRRSCRGCGLGCLRRSGRCAGTGRRRCANLVGRGERHPKGGQPWLRLISITSRRACVRSRGSR